MSAPESSAKPAFLSHFEAWEFECPCGCGRGLKHMDQGFLQRLEKARDLAAVPFILTSGMRCMTHNHAVGGSASSSHLKGLAVDIAVGGSRMRFVIHQALLGSGFTRFGIGPDFIHVDADPAKAERVTWLYRP